MSEPTLSLNCFLLGSNSSEVFTVEILKTENVSILKDLIKEKQSPCLDCVVASKLIVWKVSLPVDAITPELTVDDLGGFQELHSVKRISTIFGEALVDEHVHILVRAPIAPHPAQFLLLNCFVLRVDKKPSQSRIFTIEIPKTKNVSFLKDLIKEKQSLHFNHVAASDLILSQVSLPVDDDFEESLKNVDLTPLNPLLPVWQTFPRVDENRLHIVVQAPTNGSNQVKRPGAPDVDREESKKLRINILPSESALDSLHQRIQNIDRDSSRYSDPRKITNFPFVGDQLPTDRFNFKDFHFEYIGRTVFSALLQTVEELKLGGGYTRLYIQGIMGCGKSHILAVLAGLLSRNGKRVVYLPNCRELVGATMHYMQVALLCAFANPSSSDVREEIRALKSQDHIMRFCKQYPSMYLIIDQMNALDQEGLNMDMLDNKQKAETRVFLDQLNSGQYRITSASANYRTAVHMDKKQTNERKLSLMGGMSEDEMQQWWIHHEKRVPIFGAEDKARVEDLTGRIPLLLRPLLHFANKPFHEIEQEFWTHRDFTIIGKNVQDFAEEKRENEGQNYEGYYLPTLLGCVTSTHVTGRHKWFDYRYFYYDDEGIGNCTCGLVRQAVAVVIRQGSPALMCGDTWIQSLLTFKNNPSVVRFLVEQACLSSISLTGFHHHDVGWESLKATSFKDDLLKAIPPPENYEIFFIPKNPCKDIDALYLKVDANEKTALVVPIQITVAKVLGGGILFSMV